MFSEPFLAGARASLPALPGTFSFGIITGVAMIGAGLSPVTAMGMSLIAYAGTAQLVALQLMVTGAPLFVIVLAAFIVNLRFVLFSLTVGPKLPPLRLRSRWMMSYLLSDNGYGFTVDRFTHRPTDPENYPFLVGVCWMIWIGWESGSLVGILFGSVVPVGWSLEFVVTLTFLGFGIAAVVDRATLAAFAVGSVVAVLGWAWPLRLGLIVAAVAGVAAGLMVERMTASRPT